METLLTLTPLSSLSRVRRKRLSEINLADTDGDDADIASCNKKLWHSVQSKRFKSMDFSSNQGSFESPVRMTILLRPNRICHSDEAHRRELKEIDLTPITKLSMNLSDTYLNVEHVRRDLRKGKLKFDMNEENGYKQSICKSFKRFTQSQQLAAERDFGINYQLGLFSLYRVDAGKAMKKKNRKPCQQPFCNLEYSNENQRSNSHHHHRHQHHG
uniref:Uncharacterized protein n=1 Tax=Glossina pallidipes TaxID=7398 RepID=A0A1B0AGM2_GLOPL